MTYINADRRKKSATVRVKQDGKEKDKFPIDSAKTAHSALKLEGHAKPPLTSSQKSAINRKAVQFGVYPASDKKANTKAKKSK